MRELFFAYDTDISPKAIVVYDSSPDSAREASELLEFPLIVKPSNLAASKLVNKASNAADLEKILKESFVSLDKIYPQQRGLGNKTMVVEEFVQGDLYSTDVYVDAKGEVYVLPFVYFVNGAMVGAEGYQVYEAGTYHTLSGQDLQKGVDVAKKAVHAVGLRSSVAHVELFHTVNGWKIIELGPRIGGGRQVLYSSAYGFDHFYNDLLIHYGKQPVVNQLWHRYASGFCVYADAEGIITAIEGIDRAKQIESVDSVYANLSVGQEASFVQNGGDYVLDCKMSNSSSSKLDRDFEEVRGILKVITT